jgi:hypothetical protein
MSKNPTDTRYEISHESLFKPNLADGLHKHTLGDGTIVEAHVKDGKIAGYTAHDSSGTRISVRRLRLTDAIQVSGEDQATECLLCLCWGNTCKCWKEPCVQ